MLFIVMKLSLLVSNIVGGAGGGGGRRFLIPVMPLVIVSKIACQRMFQLSDPGVPRTFVEDCSLIKRKPKEGVLSIPQKPPPPLLPLYYGGGLTLLKRVKVKARR